jgi:ABC-2 type transport system ATP-binding protein
VIEASGLSKYFGGKRALGPVSFTIGRGETVGFLGLNGAGKTTVLRILAGDLRPSAGTLTVEGVDAVRQPLGVRRLVGFLPELPPVYPDMGVTEYIRFTARLRGMPAGPELERRLDEVHAITSLDPVRTELVRNLSQGYRQRVGLAQAIVHEPALLILDEPAHDLDPAQIVEMRRLIASLRGRHTILISSHNLPEISETCDRLLVLDAGEVIAQGTEAELSARWLGVQRTEVVIRAAEGEVASALERLRRLDAVQEVSLGEGGDEGGIVIVVESASDRRAEICRTLVEGGFDVLRLGHRQRKLESIFLGLIHGAERTRGSGNSAA